MKILIPFLFLIAAGCNVPPPVVAPSTTLQGDQTVMTPENAKEWESEEAYRKEVKRMRAARYKREAAEKARQGAARDAERRLEADRQYAAARAAARQAEIDRQYAATRAEQAEAERQYRERQAEIDRQYRERQAEIDRQARQDALERDRAERKIRSDDLIRRAKDLESEATLMVEERTREARIPRRRGIRESMNEARKSESIAARADNLRRQAERLRLQAANICRLGC